MPDLISNVKTWELGTSTSLIQPDRHGLEACRDAGIHCLEIVLRGSEDDPIQTAEPLVRWARELGLRVHSIHLPYGWDWDVSHPDASRREQALARHHHLLEQAAAWGPTVSVIHPSYEPIPADDRQERLLHCRDGMQWLSEKAQTYGIQLCVECLPRTCLGNTSTEILFLTEDTPELGVCCDVNHLFHETPQDFISKVGQKIAAVHMSDNDGIDERHWLPGKGVIDWDAVIAALAATGYSGPFMFEARGLGAESVTAEDLVTWWKRTIGLM